MTLSVDEVISGFWYAYEELPGASVREIEEAEHRLGHRLPPELRTLLQIQNGGVSNYTLAGEILLSPFRGIGPGSKSGDLVDLFLRGGVDSLPKQAVIIASDSDAWFALDYGAGVGSPSVIFWSEYEVVPIVLAIDFRRFLLMLH